jgi:hypothetical protein
MAMFMDVHTHMPGVTPEGLREAHNADLAIQDDEGVDFKQAWADPGTGHVFCAERRAGSVDPRAGGSRRRRDPRDHRDGASDSTSPCSRPLHRAQAEERNRRMP